MKNLIKITLCALLFMGCTDQNETIDYSLINYEVVEYSGNTSGRGSEDDPVLAINESVFQFINEGNSFQLNYKPYSLEVHTVDFIGTYKDQSVVVFSSKVNGNSITFVDNLNWIK